MKTHCVNGHEWITENVASTTTGTYCRLCARDVYYRGKRRHKQRQRQDYFDRVLPVYKACADLAEGGAK